jgi:hypothetical protein
VSKAARGHLLRGLVSTQRKLGFRLNNRHEKAQTGHMMGKSDLSEKHFTEAYELYRVLKPGDLRPREELLDTDFEELACFWFR